MAVNKASWRGRRVLVTGGSGFVGYWLASTLVEMGADVTVLDIKKLPTFSVLQKNYSKKIRFVLGSVCDDVCVRKIVTTRKIQTIFHLAAEAIVSRSRIAPAETLDTNVRGTWTILEAARVHAIPEIVIASSDKAYGIHTKLPYKETAALQGIYPYDCSKSAADLISQMYAQTYALPVVVARCGNIYGGGDMNGSRLIPDAVRTMGAGEEFKVRSNGKFLRDYVYITDAVSAYIAMAEGLRTKKVTWGAFNFASNKPLTVLAVLALLERVSKKKMKIQIRNEAAFEIPDQYLDAKKARTQLNWKPAVSYKKGFAATVAWYQNFFGHGGRLEK